MSLLDSMGLIFRAGVRSAIISRCSRRGISSCIQQRNAEKVKSMCAFPQQCQHYTTRSWMRPSPFASKDRKKDNLPLFGPKEVLVWVDCEMTGLLPDDVLLEVAMVITDNSLSVLADSLNVVINQPDSILDKMLPEVKAMHQSTGLVDRVRASTTSLHEADVDVRKYMGKFLEPVYKYSMAGSSIYVDLQVLRRSLPLTASCFSHRLVDVTTITELLLRWHPEQRNHVMKQSISGGHRASDDVIASIDMLRRCREYVFGGVK